MFCPPLPKKKNSVFTTKFGLIFGVCRKFSDSTRCLKLVWCKGAHRYFVSGAASMRGLLI